MVKAEKPRGPLIVFDLEQKLKERPRQKPAKAAKKAKPSGDQFMRKALEAQKAGRLTALDVSIAEDRLNRGLAVPQEIEARVYA